MSDVPQINPTLLADFCRRHGVRHLALFGSALRDDFQPESDLDLLVEFEDGVDRSLFKLVRMEDELSTLFGRTVDLTTPGSLSRYFRDQVISQAQVMYDAA